MSLNKSEHENHRIPQDAQIAQLVEQRTENPRVTGSIPVLGITQEALFVPNALHINMRV